MFSKVLFLKSFLYSGNKIFYLVLGGWVGAEIGNTVERFDPDENKWEVVGNMAVSRYYFGCCEMQGNCFRNLFPENVFFKQLFELEALFSQKCILCLLSSGAQSCLTVCDPMDCSTPGFPVHHQLLELAETLAC